MTAGTGSGPVTVERHGRVLLATMDDGRANALSTVMSGALRAVIDEAENDPSVGAVVIAGRPGRFCAGFDLGVIRGGDREAILTMVRDGGRLVGQAYGAAVPVVAACTGHAVAAGALLLLGCDHRIGPDTDVKIGLNEVAIGLTLPPWALAIAEARLSPRHLQTSVVNSRLHSGPEAVDAGFLDAVVAPDEVVGAALARAAELAELDPGAYAATVAALRGPTLERMPGDPG
jgi:enoyl-CoA hydratase